MSADSLTLLALGSLGPWEVIVILVVAMLLFGHRLPEMARSAGKAVTEFKRGMREYEDDAKNPVETSSSAGETKAVGSSAEPKEPVATVENKG